MRVAVWHNPALSPRTVVFGAVDLLEVAHARRQVREERENAAAFGTILVNSYFSAESVARAYDLPSRVCYLGVDPSLWRLERCLAHRDMLEVLAEASLLAYAPRLEPFGYAPLECGAAGIPAVAVAEGGVRETVVDGLNGLLVRRDPKEMGVAIRALLEEDPLRVALGEAAQKVVAERWSLEAATCRLEAELSRAVG